MFVKANTKAELIDETRLAVKKGFNVYVPTNLITRIVNDRSVTIKKGIEAKVPRIIIGGIGSFVIKQGKRRFAVKKGREHYVKKNGKNLDNLDPRLLMKFKVVSDGEEES